MSNLMSLHFIVWKNIWAADELKWFFLKGVQRSEEHLVVHGKLYGGHCTYNVQKIDTGHSLNIVFF